MRSTPEEANRPLSEDTERDKTACAWSEKVWIRRPAGIKLDSCALDEDVINEDADDEAAFVVGKGLYSRMELSADPVRM